MKRTFLVISVLVLVLLLGCTPTATTPSSPMSIAPTPIAQSVTSIPSKPSITPTRSGTPTFAPRPTPTPPTIVSIIPTQPRGTMETTLYDKNGKPTAYIANDDESSIYLWTGHAVAYIDGEVVYGWNGHHLGWLIAGVIYDIQGKRVGFTRDKCPVVTQIEPVKNVKYVKYVKYVRYAPYARPALSLGLSEQDFENFLKNGAVD